MPGGSLLDGASDRSPVHLLQYIMKTCPKRSVSIKMSGKARQIPKCGCSFEATERQQVEMQCSGDSTLLKQIPADL